MYTKYVILLCCLSVNAKVAIVNSNVEIEEVDNSLHTIDDIVKHAYVNTSAGNTVNVTEINSERTAAEENIVSTTNTNEAVYKDLTKTIKTSNTSKLLTNFDHNNNITLVPEVSNTMKQRCEVNNTNTDDTLIKIDLLTYNKSSNLSSNTMKQRSEVKNTNTDDTLIKIDLPTYNKSSNFYNEDKVRNATEKPDVGEALILTPLIKKGNARQARSASKVNPEVIMGLESYSGFLTVNEEYNSNLFFWYFPVPGKPVNDNPWIVWLQGGPGASCMTGLFDEIGPVTFDKTFNLKLREHSWGKEHSLLFIENPVGTGFSFTNSQLGYAHHVNTSSSELYAALQQFLQVFPELRQAPLFIAGESYAGKYIPGLAMEIHNHKETEDADINLQGLAIGNGFIEPRSMVNYSRIVYHFGLIDKHGQEFIEGMEREYIKLIDKNDNVAAKEYWTNIVIALCILTSQRQMYNFLNNDIDVARYRSFLERPDVRRAIHVGSIEYSFVNMTVNSQMRDDFLSNSRPLMETLLEHYRVLLYSGQLDQMIPYVLSAENYSTWRWSGSDDFAKAKRHPWMSNNKLSGYGKSGGNLTEVLVRGAGHMVPMDQPEAIKGLITRFIRSQTPPGHQNIEAYIAAMQTQMKKTKSDQMMSR